MPVYELKIDGAEKPRMVKAATAAAARNHVVSATPITAERMSELMEDDVKLEKASAEATAAASAEPGTETKSDEPGRSPETAPEAGKGAGK